MMARGGTVGRLSCVPTCTRVPASPKALDRGSARCARWGLPVGGGGGRAERAWTTGEASYWALRGGGMARGGPGLFGRPSCSCLGGDGGEGGGGV